MFVLGVRRGKAALSQWVRVPPGNLLQPEATGATVEATKRMKPPVKRYRVTGGHCRTCPVKDSCLPDRQKLRARFVYRGVHQDEVEAVR